MTAPGLRVQELASLRDQIETRRLQLFRLAGLCERAGYVITAARLRDAVSFTGQALSLMPTVHPPGPARTGSTRPPVSAPERG